MKEMSKAKVKANKQIKSKTLKKAGKTAKAFRAKVMKSPAKGK